MLAGVGALGLPAAARSDRPARRRVLRIAHLTDVHVQPERGAGEGLAHTLRHVHALPDAPDLLFNGGDMIMDALAAPRERAELQWDLWDRTLREHCRIPMVHCLGNHDIWGWDRARSGTTGREPGYGKRQALDRLGLERPYAGFERAGWHFVVLDSTHPREGAVYTARLDEAQFAWLEAELARVPPERPVLVLSHIPILCGCAFLDGENERSGDWRVPGAWMHIDARAIKDLFYRHRNVRLCLSGHIHLRDRLDYNGVTYLCHGAVSGGWWRGDYQETPPGYGLVDLYDDGSFEHEYVATGWQARD